MNDLAPHTAPRGDPDDRPTVTAKFHSLRTWPALLLVALMIVARYGPTYLAGKLSHYWMIAVLGPVSCALLLDFPNVLITAHQAFLTREASSEIARVTTANVLHLETGEAFLTGTTL